ncbi:MAG: AAA family ATPase [Endomicrobiaceae bacterium]|nr:AAA family ATPase [Endomicrobiaceae bacterium]
MKELAEKDRKNKYILIIDEINRGNISKIFGELITLLEKDKRDGNEYPISIPLMYSKKEFSLPNNLYIIGTMNTADKSIALVDVALRRRFAFTEMMPKAELIEENIDGVRLQTVFKALNKKITILLDRDHQIGHSYFLNIENLKQLKNKWFKEIIPLLNEYFYGDWEKLKVVLSGSFIKKVQEELLKDIIEESWTFKNDDEIDDTQFINEINNIAI